MNLTYKNIINLGIFPVLVYALNDTIQFLAQDFYILYSIDTFSHFFGGLSIAYSASYALSLFEKKKWITVQKNILRVGIIFSVVMTIAVWWEFYEFLYDYFLNPAYIMQPSITDTIKDLYMGMFGAVVFCFFKHLLINRPTGVKKGR